MQLADDYDFHINFVPSESMKKAAGTYIQTYPRVGAAAAGPGTVDVISHVSDTRHRPCGRPLIRRLTSPKENFAPSSFCF